MSEISGHPHPRLDKPTDKPATAPDIAQNLAVWMAHDRSARVLVTPDGQVMWANAAAEALEPPSAAVVIRDGRLICARPESRRKLQKYLASMEDPEASEVLEVEGAVIWAQPIHDATGCIGLTIRSAESPRFVALASMRHLTPAEARIVDMILAGRETAAIAAALDISLLTARTHVKRAYRKLGVTSRGELFAQALPFLHP